MESVGDAFAGLFLFLSNWLSPNAGNGELKLEEVLMHDSLYEVRCEQKFRWSDDATAIIDAGIPLITKYYIRSDGKQQELYTRILRSPLDERSYTVVDSLAGELSNEQVFSNVYIAVKAYKEITFYIPVETKEVELRGILQPSPVTSLDTTISLAPICGGDLFERKIILKKRK